MKSKCGYYVLVLLLFVLNESANASYRIKKIQVYSNNLMSLADRRLNIPNDENINFSGDTWSMAHGFGLVYGMCYHNFEMDLYLDLAFTSFNEDFVSASKEVGLNPNQTIVLYGARGKFYSTKEFKPRAFLGGGFGMGYVNEDGNVDDCFSKDGFSGLYFYVNTGFAYPINDFFEIEALVEAPFFKVPLGGEVSFVSFVKFNLGISYRFRKFLKFKI